MEFAELTKVRRSVRKYEDKIVSDEQIREIVSAAQMAPSWTNTQTGRYYVVRTPEKLEKFRQDVLPSFNQNRSKGAALIVTTFVKGESGSLKGEVANEIGDGWGAYDLGLQNAYMILAASNMGLDTLIMGLRHSDKIREELSIPENEEIMAVIAVGYRDGEPNFNPRKNLDDILKIY